MFLSPDPIGLAGGSNLYVYANNAPTMFTDPDGLCPRGFKPMEGNPGACVKDDRVDPNKCATGECAAGLPPPKNDCRTQSDIDEGTCEMICGWVSPGPPLPLSKTSAGKTGASYVGCKALCKNETFRRIFTQGR